MKYIDDINYLIKLLSARKDEEHFLYYNFLCTYPFYIENPYEETCNRKYIEESTFDYLLDNFDFIRVKDAPVTGRIYKYMGGKKVKNTHEDNKNSICEQCGKLIAENPVTDYGMNFCNEDCVRNFDRSEIQREIMEISKGFG